MYICIYIYIHTWSLSVPLSLPLPNTLKKRLTDSSRWKKTQPATQILCWPSKKIEPLAAAEDLVVKCKWADEIAPIWARPHAHVGLEARMRQYFDHVGKTQHTQNSTMFTTIYGLLLPVSGSDQSPRFSILGALRP